MKSDPEILDALNAILTNELTAINQYFIHAKMSDNWGYAKVAANKREESIDEMKHADAVIERILYLEGTPNMQRMHPVRVGESVPEQHTVDLELELDAVQRLNDAIRLCRDKGDNGTREILEGILRQEEAGIDHLETQLALIRDLGVEQYLSQQL